MKKFIRIGLVPHKGTDLFCACCGRFGAELAFSTGDDSEPQAGIHKKCIPRFHAKRTKTRAKPTKEPEPIACWLGGCYLAVDSEGRCPIHGLPDADGDQEEASNG